MVSRLTATTSFQRVYFQLLQFSRQHLRFSAHRAALMTKTDLIFPAFSSSFSVAQFNSVFAVSFHSMRSNVRVRFDSGVIFLQTVTNEIASFCIDNRLHQMAFFVFAKVGKGRAKAGFRIMLKYFEIKKAFCYYIKQIDSMLPCV